MFNGKGIDYVNDSFKVFKADYLFSKRGYINRWRYKNGKHKAKGYSDHLPIYAYFDIKPYKSDAKKPLNKKVEQKSIEYLYTVESLDQAIELKDVVVVLKRGRNAVVKQSKSGRGILLYACASKLKVGHRYDLLIESIKTYKGLKEVTHAYKLKEKGSVNQETFVHNYNSMDIEMFRQNEVLKNITGVYKNRHFYVEGKKIPIYFKKKNSTPKNGTKLKIHYAHLGYYKKEQLVVYSKKDFEILEK
jgi:hypothetical protein